MKVPRITQNTRIWCAIGVTRKGTLELIVELERRNNQISVVELAERDEEKCDVLSVTNSLVSNKDG